MLWPIILLVKELWVSVGYEIWQTPELMESGVKNNPNALTKN
jgi:hypothetical protein